MGYWQPGEILTAEKLNDDGYVLLWEGNIAQGANGIPKISSVPYNWSDFDYIIVYDTLGRGITIHSNGFTSGSTWSGMANYVSTDSSQIIHHVNIITHDSTGTFDLTKNILDRHALASTGSFHTNPTSTKINLVKMVGFLNKRK